MSSSPEFRYLITNVYQPVYAVTGAVGNGTSITYTCANNFTVGQAVTTTGISPSQYNKTDYIITAANSTSFTVASGSTGTYIGGGSATAPNTVIAELPFTGVNFTSQLNSIGTFQGHVLLSGLNTSSLNVYDATIPGKTILWIIYNDQNGGTFVVWSGVIWGREYDSSSQTLAVTAQEMMSVYNRRRISTTKDYSGSFYDPAVIARSLLQYTESLSHGNTGLTYNGTTTAYATKMIYNGYELKSVYQAIKDLASRFFDFKILPAWNPVSGYLYNQFQVFNGSTYSSTSPVFQFPGNVVEYKFPEDGAAAVNTLYGLGYGANNTKLLATAIDPALIVTGTQATWPLLEDTASYTDIPDVQLLKDLTLGQLNATSYPPTTLEIVIPPYIDPYYPYGYSVGDEARVDITDDFFPGGFDGILRIVGISVNPGENGPSRITITLTRQLAAGTVS